MQPRHALAAVAVAAIWGFNFVAIHVGIDSFPPLLFSALRFAAAALPVVVLLRIGPPTGWRYVLAIGLVLGVVKFSLLFVGMDVGVSAGLASLVLQTQAFFTAIFGALAFAERPRRHQLVGMLVAFAGIALLGTELDDVSTTATGLALVIAAAAAWGAANLLIKAAKPVNVLQMMVWISVVPPLPMLALSWGFEGAGAIAGALAAIDWLGVFAILYVGLVSTLGAFAVWGRLLRRYDAGQVAPFSLLVPIFGMSFSALLLGETFTLTKLAAAALVLLGLTLNLVKPHQWPLVGRILVSGRQQADGVRSS
jgi:O-acetylserine/cysteine efflux transporter